MHNKQRFETVSQLQVCSQFHLFEKGGVAFDKHAQEFLVFVDLRGISRSSIPEKAFTPNDGQFRCAHHILGTVFAHAEQNGNFDGFGISKNKFNIPQSVTYVFKCFTKYFSVW